MAISSPGIGSGLDVTSIISKLMQIEQQPLVQLQTKEASYQAKISAYGSLKSAVSTLNTALASLQVKSSETAADKFTTYKAAVGDTSIATATATSTSVAGTHSLEVQQLAQTHRITTAPRAQELTSASYASENEIIVDVDVTMDITINGTTTQVQIAADTTLNGLAQAINDSDAAVSAAIEDDGSGGKVLVLTSDAVGTEGNMTITGLGGFEYDSSIEYYELTQTQAARDGYASADATIAEGQLSITVGDGTTHEITIDSSNNTLTGLRDAINAANAGVTATLSTVGTNDVRLVVTSNTIGSNGKITMTGLAGFEFDPAGAANDLSQESADGGQAAQSSKIKLNGVTITSESNTLTNAIQGVTLVLAKETTSATTITVSKDKSTALTAAFSSVVKAYNDLNKTMRDLGAYNEETKTGGALLGNSTLRTISNSIRNLFQSPLGTSGTNYKYLSNVGLEFQKDGSIVFNSSDLASATTANYDAVAALAANFGKAADTLTDSILSSKGGIAAATSSAQASIKTIERRVTELNTRLTQIQARYQKQYSALDSLVASMNSTSSYLTQQLSNLSSSSS